MTSRMMTTCAALAFVAALQPTPSQAKPGDLPVDVSQQCNRCRATTDNDAATRLAAWPWASADAAADGSYYTPPAPGSRWADRDPSPRPAHQVRDDAGRRRPPTEADLVADSQAQHLYDLAERSRRSGDYVKARICYEEAHLLSPTSRHGRAAIDRLRSMDRERFGGPGGDAEEADAPPPLRRAAAEQRRGTDPAKDGAPEREPQLPRLPDAERFHEMLESTEPLGGAEESTLPPNLGDAFVSGEDDAWRSLQQMQQCTWFAPRRCFDHLFDVEQMSFTNPDAWNGKNHKEASNAVVFFRAYRLRRQSEQHTWVILENVSEGTDVPSFVDGGSVHACQSQAIVELENRHGPFNVRRGQSRVRLRLTIHPEPARDDVRLTLLPFEFLVAEDVDLTCFSWQAISRPAYPPRFDPQARPDRKDAVPAFLTGFEAGTTRGF